MLSLGFDIGFKRNQQLFKFYVSFKILLLLLAVEETFNDDNSLSVFL